MPDTCIACGGRCEASCPFDAIVMDADGAPIISPEKCKGCVKCVKVCPAQALEMFFTLEEQRILEEVRQGHTRNYETVRRGKAGQRVEVSLTVSPIKDGHGQIIGVSSIARDITHYKRAQREVQESRARFSAIITSAMDAVISVDARQRITMFNTAAEKMFGCPAAQVLGQPLDRLIPERSREVHRQYVDEFGRTGATARGMAHLRPLAALRADGTEFPIEASISQAEVAGEKIYTVILRDITERQQTQQALEQQARVLSLIPISSFENSFNVAPCTS
jgi:PAS domain S-box-containing protein